MPSIGVNLPCMFTVCTKLAGLPEQSTAEKVASSSRGYPPTVVETGSPESRCRRAVLPRRPPRLGGRPQPPLALCLLQSPLRPRDPPWVCAPWCFPLLVWTPVTGSEDGLTSAKAPFPKQVTVAGTRVRAGVYQKQTLFEALSQTEKGKYWMTSLVCRI